jgi:hypothetical protein
VVDKSNRALIIKVFLLSFNSIQHMHVIYLAIRIGNSRGSIIAYNCPTNMARNDMIPAKDSNSVKQLAIYLS